jgi:MFS superfamily sulfate permease-like transporter
VTMASSNKSVEDKDDKDYKKPEGASHLVNLFAPPPETTETTETTSLGVLGTSHGNLRNEAHNRQSPQVHQVISPLATLFTPPSIKTAPPASASQSETTTTSIISPGASSLVGLFAPPPFTSTPTSTPTSASKSTPKSTTTPTPSLLQTKKLESTLDEASASFPISTNNNIDAPKESTALLSEPYDNYFGSPVLVSDQQHPHFTHNKEGDRDDAAAAGQAFRTAKALRKRKPILSLLPNISHSRIGRFCKQHLQPTTFAGAFMFLLYHVVFCLANGSAIIRPHSMEKPILGIMAKMSSVGILSSAPFYIYRLGQNIPALYPSIDLFLAPFLAQTALDIDESLTQEYGGTYPDDVFFASFAVLTGIGMLLSGCFLQLAASFKLANLGTYLPYPVLCGFFSAVGVLLWALAFSVDTSGKTWKMVFFSGDSNLIGNSCLHHFPSLVVGILMNRLGPKNPFFVILLIVATLVCFYSVMWITGTSLEDAQEAQWFWSSSELNYDRGPVTEGFYSWTLPPTPFANVFCVFSKDTNWRAVSNGLGNMAALAFLYLLRSSIHASALKKNIGNLVRRVPKAKDENNNDDHATTGRAYSMASNIFGSMSQGVQNVNISLADKMALRSRFSVAEDLDNMDVIVENSKNRPSKGGKEEGAYKEIRAKSTQKTLEDIFTEYGYALFVVAGCGGFGNCPTVATSNTMFAIGAEGTAPQYGSVILLIIFYFTDFELVQYIPKCVFSSLLVLGAVDTFSVWFIAAYRKTQDLAEWLVVPIIVGFSLFVGFLNAIFIGIAISMFVFVASFLRVGVVKFNSTGLELRSRIERSMTQSVWLDSHGDYMQVLVLQNYLFFGNASSVLNYIATMFEEVDEAESLRLDFSLPPVPKVLILDLSLITGMDTSTVDIFADIKELCKNNECRLYLAGLSPRMRKGFALGGIKPDTGIRSMRFVRFFPDLDTTLGVAEDFLIQNEMETIISENHPQSLGDGGFQHALKQIDELHGQEFADGLLALQPFVVPLELQPGHCLFQSDGGTGIVNEGQRGLFFIESGLLKIERDTSQSLTLTRTRSNPAVNTMSAALTLKHQHARMGAVARKAALAKSSSVHGAGPQNLRIARIGPGW